MFDGAYAGHSTTVQNSNSWVFAVVGAIATATLVMPAARQLGTVVFPARSGSKAMQREAQYQ
jgi:hypothetical protein